MRQGTRPPPSAPRAHEAFPTGITAAQDPLLVLRVSSQARSRLRVGAAPLGQSLLRLCVPEAVPSSIASPQPGPIRATCGVWSPRLSLDGPLIFHQTPGAQAVLQDNPKFGFAHLLA